MILENIRKVEQLLAQKVISEDREKKFHSDLSKFATIKTLELILRICIGTGTLGIALIF